MKNHRFCPTRTVQARRALSERPFTTLRAVAGTWRGKSRTKTSAAFHATSPCHFCRISSRSLRRQTTWSARRSSTRSTPRQLCSRHRELSPPASPSPLQRPSPIYTFLMKVMSKPAAKQWLLGPKGTLAILESLFLFHKTPNFSTFPHESKHLQQKNFSIFHLLAKQLLETKS